MESRVPLLRVIDGSDDGAGSGRRFAQLAEALRSEVALYTFARCGFVTLTYTPDMFNRATARPFDRRCGLAGARAQILAWLMAALLIGGLRTSNGSNSG